ncbi:hypothetical protein ACLB2K_045269 [Fragaria x ananassa]
MVWNSLSKPVAINNSFAFDWQDWFHTQLKWKIITHKSIKWCNFFIGVCWFLWKWRNKRIFYSSFVFPSDPGKIILNAAVEWNSATVKAKVTMDCDYNLFTWKKPPEIFFKLNVDGSRSSTSGKIGAGGVIRDQNGIWITGFQVNLGIGAIVDAEAWGIYYGCHFLSSNMENIKFSHIFRECNMTADSLAKMSINHAPGLVILKEPPIHAAFAYLDDLNDVPRPRAKRTGDSVVD